MYDINLIRKLCADIQIEPDPVKVEDLLALLHAVIKDEQEEIRVRTAFLTSKYAAAVSDAKAAD